MGGLIKELTIHDLAYFCPENLLADAMQTGATTEDELCVVGQQAALANLEIGAKTRVQHIYVSGIPGTGRTGLTITALEKLSRTMPAPGDLCYVQNFRDPTEPRKLLLPPGQGREFAESLKLAIRTLRKGLDQRLKSEEVQAAQTALKREFEERMRQELSNVEKLAHDLGLILKRTEMGLVAVPFREENAEQPQVEDEHHLGEAQGESSRHLEDSTELEKSAGVIRQAMAEAGRRIEKMRQELVQGLEKMEEEVIDKFINEVMSPLLAAWPQPDVGDFLQELTADLKEQIPLLLTAVAEGSVNSSDLRRFWQRYEVNCFVSHDADAGAPVVYEPNPTYYNIFGEQEYHTDGRMAVTNHMFLKSGAIHRANGGWLVLPAREVLINLQTWSALKQALKRRRVGVENLRADLRLMPMGTLKPEEVDLDLQVILIGTPELYYALYKLDPDFSELFGYRVEFSDRIPFSVGGVKQYGQYIVKTCQQEGLPVCSPGAAARLVEYGVRMTGNRTRLSTRMGEIRTLLCEAAAWAKLAGRNVILSSDILAVLQQREQRGNLVWRRVMEQIKHGQLLLQTTGSAVGEINGLAVYDLGDLQFARPVRITANTYLGQQGLTHIEREIQLSGRIHSKGVLAIAGYFGAKYGQKRPISFSASICFEQSYSEIEGDSASAAELLALLSSISSVPFRQDLAITGSVNQKGKIQPVGGVTTKVEGFFRVCKLLGLTGSQGVVIPTANVEDLVLERDVLQAIRAGRFHIYPVSHIDEAIELFIDPETGMGADELHRTVEQVLVEWWRLQHLEDKDSTQADDADDSREARRIGFCQYGMRQG